MSDKSGFTLIEMMVVIAVFGILSAIAAPQVSTALQRQRVASAAFELRGILVAAKMAALKHQANVIVRFVSGTGNQGKYSVVVNTNVVRQGAMPKGVVLSHANFNGEPEIQFNAMGFTYGSYGDIRIRDDRGIANRRIVVTPVGSIRIKKS